MLHPNRCPRCGGNLLFTREDGDEWRCLQCGRGFQATSPATTIAERAARAVVACIECGDLVDAELSAKRRYCSDRCRMRAARRRWAEQAEVDVAV